MINELGRDIDIYRVNGIHEEFDCLYCGCPVYHGNTARMVNGLAYCSKQCADSYDEYSKRGPLVPRGITTNGTHWSLRYLPRSGSM